MPTTSPSQQPNLPRVLNASHATAIVVGTIIGSGIFLVPQEMMRAVGSSGLVYLAWIVGGLLSLFGAMTYAELGAMMPYAGGEYVYLRGAYGDLTAFLYMWTWFAVAKPASIASVTTGLARTLAIFPAFSWLDRTALFAITWAQIFAIGATWLITGLNYLGIKKAGDFQLVFTWLKGLMILVIVGFCFTSRQGSLFNFQTSFHGATGGFGGFMIAMIAALWAYDGWNDLNMVAGEVRHPQRSLPLALIGGLFIVGGLYMATNAAIQYILPAATIAASPRPAVAALGIVTGPWGASLVSAVMALSIFVTLNGTIMSGARVPFAAARDRLFFTRMAHIHPRFESPSTSLVVQAALTTLLLLAVGRFQQLFELAIFAEWLFYMVTATTVFVYRRRMPDLDRPYRVWGYPVLPALFVLAAAVLLFYSYAENFRNSLLGSAIILLGVPLFAVIRKHYAIPPD
ncbi:APC family permease [Acidipila rosea]|uniref:Amino acid/polyamine/organocation transporter (APC superfamily) n=1 Tax=Acidipila rosea TaxID=768535 RepID=A0A4R1LBV7_9BACT|nr:amino acid permease [Acidipila rosea]TCK75976.1 amino acid/polyamine/organocation transporter (APC superfamily) [Acidipila rosea]